MMFLSVLLSCVINVGVEMKQLGFTVGNSLLCMATQIDIADLAASLTHQGFIFC